MKKLFKMFVMCLVLLFSPNIFSQVTFAGSTNFTLGNGTKPSTHADINGDGKQDIIASRDNFPNNKVIVLLNTTTIGAGTPTFSSVTDFTIQGVGGNNSIASADLNSDGKPDIVVSNYSLNTVSVLLNETPNGAATPTFSTYASFTAGSATYYVAIDDINGDGKPDIVTANLSANTVSVLLNTTSNGASTPTFSSKTDFTVGTNPNSVSIADLNGDGKPDIVTANEGANTVSVLLNTTTNGASTPTFTSKADFAVGAHSSSIAIADLNGDNKPDIVTGNVTANTVSVLLNTTSNGASSPTFSSKTDFTVGTSPGSVAIADFDGDGISDIVTCNRVANTVSVLINTTANGASTPSFSSKSDFGVGSYPWSVTDADINGDNKPDVITSNNGASNASVLLNTTSFPSAIIWDGSESANWDTGANWSTNAVPIASDNVTIPDVATDPIISSADAVCNHLTVSWGASVTINAGYSLSVDGALINNAGIGGLVINSSDATGSGSLIHLTTGVDGTVKRYFTDNSWHLVTPSTTGVTANDFYWSDAPKAWLTSHAESTNGWTYNTNLATPMPVGQGWSLWLDNNTKSVATTTMTGTLRASDLSVSLDYSGSDANQDWNLIGNPFPSAIDKDSGSWGTNTTGTVYVWVNGDNDYRYYNTVGGGTLTGGVIPTSQGFFVKSTSAGSFTIPTAARINSTQGFYKSMEEEVLQPFVRLDLSTANNTTVAFVGFPEGGTSNFDINMDADRLYGSLETPQMIIPEEDRNLCINASAPLAENETRIVPLHVMFFIDGEYDLTISDLDNLPGVQIILEDLLTGSHHDLLTNNTYLFSANAGDNPARFLLHFKSNPNGVENPASSTLHNLKIYTWRNTIFIQSNGEAVNQEGVLRLYDLTGRLLSEQQISKGELVSVPVNFSNSYIIAKVIKVSEVKTEILYIKY